MSEKEKKCRLVIARIWGEKELHSLVIALGVIVDLDLVFGLIRKDYLEMAEIGKFRGEITEVRIRKDGETRRVGGVIWRRRVKW